MSQYKPAVLRAGYARTAFTVLLDAVPKKTRNIEFLVDAEVAFSRFCRTLLEEEAGRGMCSPNRATGEGSSLLLLLDCLFFLTGESPDGQISLVPCSGAG